MNLNFTAMRVVADETGLVRVQFEGHSLVIRLNGCVSVRPLDESQIIPPSPCPLPVQPDPSPPIPSLPRTCLVYDHRDENHSFTLEFEAFGMLLHFMQIVLVSRLWHSSESSIPLCWGQPVQGTRLYCWRATVPQQELFVDLSLHDTPLPFNTSISYPPGDPRSLLNKVFSFQLIIARQNNEVIILFSMPAKMQSEQNDISLGSAMHRMKLLQQKVSQLKRANHSLLESHSDASSLKDQIRRHLDGINTRDGMQEIVQMLELSLNEVAEKELVLMNEQCMVCDKDVRQVMFLPCLHVCACPSCASGLMHCPMCKTRIQQRQ